MSTTRSPGEFGPPEERGRHEETVTGERGDEKRKEGRFPSSLTRLLFCGVETEKDLVLDTVHRLDTRRKGVHMRVVAH